MERKLAIRTLAVRGLRALSAEEREEQLCTMASEAWDEDPKWASLPADVRREFDEGAGIRDSSHERYDPVLMIWLESTFDGATNEYLAKLLREAAVDVVSVVGDEPELTPCPCCGLRTLSRRGEYDICRVCWWEDDGLDNEQAGQHSGPNHLSLAEGRLNYLREGIFDPGRPDLRELQEPSEKYHRGRSFRLSPDGQGLSEDGTDWHVDTSGAS